MINSIVITLLLVLISSISYAASIIKIDGSSTVYPITEAVAEELQRGIAEG